MKHMKRVIRATLLLVTMILALTLVARYATAEGSDRQTTIVVSYTEYEWWLTRWTDNAILCQISIDHEGLPTDEEVLQNCGQELLTEWQTTPPCEKATRGNTAGCEGLYLHLVSSQQKEREVVVNLPPATAYVTLEGCNPIPPENRCDNLPNLLITGEEPLPNEHIISIQGTFGGQPFTCQGAVCSLPLQATPPSGIQVEFFAESSYGDASDTYTAQVRVIDAGVPSVPGSGGWYVDVLSSQWRGAPPASCSETWQAFPPIGGLPQWLDTPSREELLASDEPYYYLAGRLISQGVVDGSSCQTGGLLPNGYADACGLEAAKPIVAEWQNQFDARIIQASRETDVPAQLLKNLFAQESQFWPGVFRVPFEFGLGQITDNGADTVLLWNGSFFEQFCPLVLAQDTCSQGYLHLKPDEQKLLRGALAIQAKADCPECTTGVDLTNVNFNMNLFANTLRASCDQVTQIVFNATNEVPGQVSSYEDLWRLTVANYHAGPGCVSFAVYGAWSGNQNELLWDEVKTRLTEPCQGVVPYVEKITNP
jgi:hypothetical protein